MAEKTCNAALAARDTLASCGITLDTPVEIQIVDSITGDMGNCLGVYHCGEGRIEVLSPDALQDARETDGPFADISNEAYWNSILVHELTHAAYDRVTCPFSSCVATSEYASYAMQVRSLPPDEQAKFGQSVTLKTKPTRDAITAMGYFMSPDRFAKTAWLHFSTRPDPCAYMSYIMQGDLFFDMEPL